MADPFADLDGQQQQPQQPPPVAAPAGDPFGDLDLQRGAAQNAPPPAPAEARSFTPAPSKEYSDWMADRLRGLGMSNYNANKFGDAAAFATELNPWVGVPLNAADAAYHFNRGEYGSAALSTLGVAPVVGPIARGVINKGMSVAERLAPNFADVVVPGMKFSETPLVQEGKVFAPSPSSTQLTKTGAAQFDAFRNNPVTYAAPDMQDLVLQLRDSQRGHSAVSNPATNEAITKLEEKATRPGYQITPQDLDDFRVETSRATKKFPSESGAMDARSVVFKKLEDLGDTTMRDAVQNYGAGKRTGIVETILSRAERAKDPATSLASQLRSNVNTLETRPRGFTTEEVQALDDARKGSLPLRVAEGTSNVLTGKAFGPSGPAAMVASPIAGGLGTLGGLLTAKTGGLLAVPPAVGYAMRPFTEAARFKAAEGVADKVASRSPLFREAEAISNANPLYQPGTPAQSAIWRNAITQSILDQQRNNGGY